MSDSTNEAAPVVAPEPDHTAPEQAPPVAPVVAPEPPAPEPPAPEPEPPAPEPEPPAPEPEAPAFVPDTATACAALIEAHSGALRIIRQAVGAVPALGGLSVPLEVIERQLDVARKALSPPVE